MERLSLEEFILRLNMLRLVSLLPVSGGFAPLRDEIEAADEPESAAPLSGVRGGEVDCVEPVEA